MLHLPVWQHLHVLEAISFSFLLCALWVRGDKQEGLLSRRRHPFVIDTSTRALRHLSLISEYLNVMCSVERLPADSWRQIKSLTVESKALSLSLDKHERSGGDGLRVPSVSQPWQPAARRLPRGWAAVRPSVSALKFSGIFKQDLIFGGFSPLKLKKIYKYEWINKLRGCFGWNQNLKQT